MDENSTSPWASFTLLLWLIAVVFALVAIWFESSKGALTAVLFLGLGACTLIASRVFR